MLGRALCEELAEKHEIVGLDINRAQTTDIECDITKKEKTVSEVVSIKPDLVIHAAAYTDVDGSEENPDQAMRVNAQGTKNVAQACKESGCLLIYISTDFVFDGEKKSAYTESDRPNPINAYGKSKLEGEKYLQSISKNSLIVRSSWLFGRGGRNFVDSLLEKAKSEKEISVVDDQVGSPTYTRGLAGAIGELLDLAKRPKGIFHVTNSGSCSWYEFACAIKEIAKLETNIVRISSERYRSPARRPKMSVLDNKRYQELSDDKLPHWKDALKGYLLQ